MKEFNLKEEHIKLLSNSYVSLDESYSDFGSVCIDKKRPYGNSGVVGDIYKILNGKELDEQELNEQGISYDEFCDKLYEEYLELHRETETALQIILHTKSFEVGAYRRNDYSKDWVKINKEEDKC